MKEEEKKSARFMMSGGGLTKCNPNPMVINSAHLDLSAIEGNYSDETDLKSIFWL